jgi:hypothetical protein
MQSNPYQAQQESSTTSQAIQIPHYDARPAAPAISGQTQPEPQQAYWAGNEDLTQFLEENGVSSIQDLLQYTAGQEQSAEQMQEIFEYAMHPDPEIRQEFWSNYEQALAEQGLIEQPQQQQYQAPSLPGTPQNYGYSSYQQPGFSNPEQFAQQVALMNSGLPNITPQALAEFDRAVMMTDGRFWGQNVLMFGDL